MNAHLEDCSATFTSLNNIFEHKWNQAWFDLRILQLGKSRKRYIY